MNEINSTSAIRLKNTSSNGLGIKLNKENVFAEKLNQYLQRNFPSSNLHSQMDDLPSFSKGLSNEKYLSYMDKSESNDRLNVPRIKVLESENYKNRSKSKNRHCSQPSSSREKKTPKNEKDILSSNSQINNTEIYSKEREAYKNKVEYHNVNKRLLQTNSSTMINSDKKHQTQNFIGVIKQSNDKIVEEYKPSTRYHRNSALNSRRSSQNIIKNYSRPSSSKKSARSVSRSREPIRNEISFVTNLSSTNLRHSNKSSTNLRHSNKSFETSKSRGRSSEKLIVQDELIDKKSNLQELR